MSFHGSGNPLAAELDAHSAAVAAATRTPTRLRRRGSRQQESSTKAGSPSSSSTTAQLHSYDSLPEYLRDNEFIHTGYRYNLPIKDTLKSLFNLHNETGNVWSHLIGFVLFVILTIWISRSPPAPLLLAKPQVEELWHAVRDQIHSIRDSMGENLHVLSDRLPSLNLLHDKLAQFPYIQHNLQHLQASVHGKYHQWQESVHHIQDTLQGSWQHGMHSFQESVHSLQDRVQMGANALATQLLDALDALPPHVRPGQLLSGMSRDLQWPTARWPAYVFCAGAMSCLLLSAICHLFGCCKQHIALFIWRLDYAGIALLIVSSFYPIVYYSFLCQPIFTAAYLSVITVLGTCAISMSLLEVFQKPEWRPTRAMLYVGLGCMGVIPLLHVLALHGDVWHVKRMAILDALMGLSYIAGAAVYALRVPERWFPGKFDILLHSHQIFHLFVVLGAVLHYKAVLLLLEWRDASGGCAVPVTQGPLTQVIDEMSAHGHDLLHIDQVWEWLSAAVLHQLHPAAGGRSVTEGVMPTMPVVEPVMSGAVA